MKKVLYIIALLSTLLCVSSLEAQNPVKWSTHNTKVRTGVWNIVLRAEVKQGFHIYDTKSYENGPNPTSFTITANGATLIGAIKPNKAPKIVFDKNFEMEIGYWGGTVEFTQQVELTSPKASVDIIIEWMACDDTSCIPPDEKQFTISLADNAVVANTAKATTDTAQSKKDTLSEVEPTKTTDAELPVSEQTVVSSAPQQGPASLWAIIIEAILWGFAALLTPCVFPMIPMTVSYFIKSNSSPIKGRINAAIYGLFIVALYTLPIAVIILITKVLGGDSVTADIFNFLATHWIPNVIFFVVFMLFAASFFGAFEITMPSSMVNKSDRGADRGGLIGIFFMALTLVLVSFSCTGPIVGSVLIKSTAGEFWTPILTMVAFSSAFALPFVLFALFPSMLSSLPKSGGWLGSVKVVLGFLEVALGLKFLSVADQTYHWGLLDREVYLAIWIVVFSLLGLYLLGKLQFKHDTKVEHVGVLRLFLAMATFSFVVYMVPGMFGAPLKALSGYMPPITTQDFVIGQSTTSVDNNTKRPKYSDFLHLPHNLQGYFDYTEALEQSRKVGKPILVDFTGHGCVNCREMESKVWSDGQVLDMLRNDYVILALYSDDKKELPETDWVVTENGRTLKNLGKINSNFALTMFGVNAQPYYIILNSEGFELVPPKGYDLNVQNFVDFLRSGIRAYDESKIKN